MVTDDVAPPVGLREIQRRQHGAAYEALTHCATCDVFWEACGESLEELEENLEQRPRCDCQWREHFREQKVSREQQMLQMVSEGMYTVAPMRGVILHVDYKESKVTIKMDGSAGVYVVPVTGVLPAGPTGLWLENFREGMS